MPSHVWSVATTTTTFHTWSPSPRLDNSMKREPLKLRRVTWTCSTRWGPSFAPSTQTGVKSYKIHLCQLKWHLERGVHREESEPTVPVYHKEVDQAPKGLRGVYRGTICRLGQIDPYQIWGLRWGRARLGPGQIPVCGVPRETRRKENELLRIESNLPDCRKQSAHLMSSSGPSKKRIGKSCWATWSNTLRSQSMRCSRDHHWRSHIDREVPRLEESIIQWRAHQPEWHLQTDCPIWEAEVILQGPEVRDLSLFCLPDPARTSMAVRCRTQPNIRQSPVADSLIADK
jgi:hypothetical protein